MEVPTGIPPIPTPHIDLPTTPATSNMPNVNPLCLALLLLALLLLPFLIWCCWRHCCKKVSVIWDTRPSPGTMPTARGLSPSPLPPPRDPPMGRFPSAPRSSHEHTEAQTRFYAKAETPPPSKAPPASCVSLQVPVSCPGCWPLQGPGPREASQQPGFGRTRAPSSRGGLWC